MARQDCPHVFPNYDARFHYPEKSGQIRLFRKTGAPHPETLLFKNLGEYPGQGEKFCLPPGFSYPCVFKFDWGGEGDNIIFIHSRQALAGALETAKKFERTGQRGFLLQSYIPSKNRILRVVIIDQKMIAYWKIQMRPDSILAGVAKGARIDPDSDPRFQQKGIKMVGTFCSQTGIDLAGLDLLFPEQPPEAQPLFLEINYFFGRKGLGGSERFYQELNHGILNWIDRKGLSRPNRQMIACYE